MRSSSPALKAMSDRNPQVERPPATCWTRILIGILKRWDDLPGLLAPEFRPLYCSSLSRSELFQKRGLSNAERWAMRSLLSGLRVLFPDHDPLQRYDQLRCRYACLASPASRADALIAGTAWSKRLPLVTMNLAHYRFVREITVLSPADLLT